MHIAGSITPAQKSRVNRLRELIEQGVYETPTRVAIATDGLLRDLIAAASAPRPRPAPHAVAVVHE